MSRIDLHTLIGEVRELADKLGRTPTYGEFTGQCRRGSSTVSRVCGTYLNLLSQAGLEPIGNGKKIDNTIFNRDIEKHLESYNSNPSANVFKEYPTAAIISDIHWPFSSQRVIDAFISYVSLEKPEYVIINGDAWDMYSHGKFPRSHNVFTPRDEQDMARIANEQFWVSIKKASPNSKCIQMLGNHDIRPMKRVLDAYPEAEDWIKEKLKDMFTFNGVETIFDPRKELYLRDDIIVFHGYRTKLGDHRDYTLLSTVNGHPHQGGVVFRKVRGAVIFELNSGFAGDPDAKGLTYTPQRITNWTPGFAVINKNGPQFIIV